MAASKLKGVDFIETTEETRFNLGKDGQAIGWVQQDEDSETWSGYVEPNAMGRGPGAGEMVTAGAKTKDEAAKAVVAAVDGSSDEGDAGEE